MPHILIVSIGPVQEFIASARKCQDLWFGSWLLSALARAAARGVRDAAGGDQPLVFPASLDDDARKPAVANKIVACVEGSPAEVAASGRDAMASALDAIVKAAFDKVHPDYFRREVAEAQTRDLMEYVWASAPIDAGGYAVARRTAERLLAARKRQRSWGPVTWGAMVPKSSLDGLRESVLDERLYDAIASGRISAESARRQYFVKSTERLCGVGLLKRVGTELDDAGPKLLQHRPNFHSTSHVASAPVRARIRKLGVTAAFAPYRAELESKLRRNLRSVSATAPELAGLDGRVLYEGQVEAILSENDAEFPAGGRDRADGVKNVRSVLRRCLRSADLSVDEVPTYYAVLLADGDFMGRTLDEVGERHGQDGQRRVASALDDFSGRCATVVEDHDGSLVYAGGDDVLALLPLHTALTCARELNSRFGAIMKSALEGMRVSCVPSLSVGLGISHHLDEMADARALAKRAEGVAKAVPGKNALAVMAQLRSGGRLDASGSFGDPSPLDRRLEGWVGHLLRDEIPGKVAHDLEAQLAPLIVGGGAAELAPDVFKSLTRRLFARKRADRGEAPLSESVAEKLAAVFDRGTPEAALSSLVDELQLASLLATAYAVATPSPRAVGYATEEAP